MEEGILHEQKLEFLQVYRCSKLGREQNSSNERFFVRTLPVKQIDIFCQSEKNVAEQVENMIKTLLKKHDSYVKRDKEFKSEKVFSREYL